MTTIRRQLTRTLTASFLVLLTLAGVGVYVTTRQALVAQFDAGLRTKALVVAAATGPDEDDPGVEVAERIAREFNQRFPTDQFQLWHKAGTLVERSASLKQADLPFKFGPTDTPALWDVTLPDGEPGRAVGIVFEPRDRPHGRAVGDLVLVVASHRRDLDRTLQTLALVLAVCGALLLAVTPLIVPRLLKRQLAPLDALAEQVVSIGADSLGARFALDPMPGEIAPVTARLNDLLARLEASFERERRFSADLAHELRTPIAELRSLAEFSLKWPHARDTVRDRDALNIAERMEGLITTLLTLHRGDEKIPLARHQSIGVAEVVRRLLMARADRISAKQLRVESSVAEELTVSADPVLLDSILANLIENAVDYTPCGGRIRIDADAVTEPFELRVTNTSPGISASDVSRFFDRLWRQDPSRADGTHHGLGLSLARTFAAALGWSLDATLVDDGDVQLSLGDRRRA